MTEKGTVLNIILALIGLVLAFSLILHVASYYGFFPFSYTYARTPRELLEILESRTAHVRGVSVNGHLLEIGKRPSLQIIRGYDDVMFQVRPYRQVNYRYRNFTRAEVVDLCTNITGDAFEALRPVVETEKGYEPAWKGKVKGKDIIIVRVTQFSYLVAGMGKKTLFIGQVELAKRLGMSDKMILEDLLPAQINWLNNMKSRHAIDESFLNQSTGYVKDVFIAWLDETKRMNGY